MKFLSVLIGSLFWVVAGAAQAQESSGVLQLFACKLNEGKTAANVWDLLETLSARVTAPPAGYSLFLWTPFRGTFEYDYVWGITSSDLVSMAEGYNGFVSSGSAELMGPRFAEVNERCDSSISLMEDIQPGAIGNTGDRMPDAVVETFVCTVNAGSTMADVDAAVAFWKAQIPKTGSEALGKYQATLLRPFRGNSGQADFAWIGASPDLTTWARGGMDYLASKDGQAADARFQKVSSCRNAVWNGYWIVPPTEE